MRSAGCPNEKCWRGHVLRLPLDRPVHAVRVEAELGDLGAAVLRETETTVKCGRLRPGSRGRLNVRAGSRYGCRSHYRRDQDHAILTIGKRGRFTDQRVGSQREVGAISPWPGQALVAR